MNFKQHLPFLDWLPTYTRTHFKKDLVAGLTVGVMLIPQSMAYALIAGLPPIYGLYASIVPLIIYAFLGTSRQLAIGPTAMISLLTLAGLQTLSIPNDETFIALAITLALLIGVIQFLMGVFKLGFLVNFLSHPVLNGFTSAAAIIISVSQLKHLLGIDLSNSIYVHEVIFNIFKQIPAIHLPTLLVGIVGILLIKGLKKISRRIPSALVVVMVGILAIWSLGLEQQAVKIVGSVPEGLPHFTVPILSLELLQQLMPLALTIALLSFIESISIAKSVEEFHPEYKVLPNQELIAQGLSKIGGAFFQSLPTTGSFSRTAINDQTGAKTGIASVVTAGLIVVTLLFLTPLFYYLPKAVLAAIIVVAVFGLVDFQTPKALWYSDRSDFYMLFATFIITLSLGIQNGILTGVVLSLVVMIYQSTKPHVAVLGRIEELGVYRNIERFPEATQRPDVLIVRYDAQLYFANVSHFKNRIDELIDEKGIALGLVVLDAHGLVDIDSSGIRAVQSLFMTYKKRDIYIYIASVLGPVRDAFQKSGLTDALGSDTFYARIYDAVRAYDEKRYKQALDKQYAMQTNVEDGIW